MNVKRVGISLDASGQPVPDQDPIRIRSFEERIEWTASFPFVIQISGYDDLYPVDGGYRTGAFAQPRRYKYSIEANGRINDPDIEVLPPRARRSMQDATLESLPGTEDGDDW